MTFVVLGSSGFIGSHLVDELHRRGIECLTPEPDDHFLYEHPLGHVIYCIGITADFRNRPLETAHAHICQLLKILGKSQFQSLLYLSSTRLYGGSDSGAENAKFTVTPLDPSDVYNLSKLMGESLCFACNRPEIRVARLSNVYGADWSSSNFLPSITRAAVDKGTIVLHTSLESSKDYVFIDDVVNVLLNISLKGQEQLYNIASGVNVSNSTIIETLAELTGCSFTVVDGAPTISFPSISITRIQKEFDFSPTMISSFFPSLVSEYKRRKALSDNGGHW